MIDTYDKLLKDLEAVRRIPIVPTMLEVVCQVTGMGFAAVARVTQDRWLACRVRDEVQFGLTEGSELAIETTLCNEIRDHRTPIIIDDVASDSRYKNHHTPKIYGLQSYISFPIILKDGTFFGTICAIDAKPTRVNTTKVIHTFSMFAELLAFHLESQDVLERSHTAALELHEENRLLTDVNANLGNFVYTASHDLRSPLANIEGLLNILSASVGRESVDRQEVDQIIDLMKFSLQRFAVTVKDLTTFVEAENHAVADPSEEINITEVADQVKEDLASLIAESDAKITVICADNVSLRFSKRNFKSIFYNLLSNAIKYRSPERLPKVLVQAEPAGDKVRLSVSDNGLGIPADKQANVFTIFKRFHGHVEGSGLGLYLVKRIVDASGGQIQVDSTLNQGTTFTILL